MKVLGIRCSNNDYTYCILSGSSSAPIIEEIQRLSFPAGYSEPEALLWFYRELQGLFKRNGFDSVGIKRSEVSVKRSNNLELRIQNEAIVSLVAAEAGVSSVQRKVKPTIAKDLGLKGKSKYLETRLDTSVIDGFDSYSNKEREAILTAWSCMS